MSSRICNLQSRNCSKWCRQPRSTRDWTAGKERSIWNRTTLLNIPDCSNYLLIAEKWILVSFKYTLYCVHELRSFVISLCPQIFQTTTFCQCWSSCGVTITIVTLAKKSIDVKWLSDGSKRSNLSINCLSIHDFILRQIRKLAHYSARPSNAKTSKCSWSCSTANRLKDVIWGQESKRRS